MSTDGKCKNPHCEQPADDDVSSQGYCLRCVGMWIGGVNPEVMMQQGVFMARVKDQREALRKIRELEHEDYDPTVYDSREQFYATLVRSASQYARKALGE